MKKCSKCSKKLSDRMFYSSNRHKDGLLGWCKKCEQKRTKHYRLLNPEKYKEQSRRLNLKFKSYHQEYRQKNKEKISKQKNDWKKRNNEKMIAYWKTASALESGRIYKSLRCDKCGSSELIDLHHEDYSKPLEVISLCKPCHRKRHIELRRINEDQNYM